MIFWLLIVSTLARQIPNGVCIGNSTCNCTKGYVSIPPLECNYEQSVALTALALEISLGLVGGGYLYIEQYYLGFGQLFLSVIGIFSLVFSCRQPMPVGKVGLYCCIIPLVVWSSGVVAWWIAACVMISNGQINDGNGISLAF